MDQCLCQSNKIEAWNAPVFFPGMLAQIDTSFLLPGWDDTAHKHK